MAFTKKDFPYVLGMIVLDIVAPILLMFGLLDSASSNASLLNNFEIVCTSLIALLLGFVAYGLSIFFYIKAQGIIGASKTSANYSVAPFIGTFLSFIIFQEKLTWSYFVGLAIMIIGTIIVVIDTLAKKHNHIHKHVIIHTRDGSTHSHVVEHEHEHNHYLTDEKHIHLFCCLFFNLYFSYSCFPGGSEAKASASNAGDLGLIPGSGRSPGEGNGNPLQYSCLEGYSPWGREESDTTERLHFHFGSKG